MNAFLGIALLLTLVFVLVFVLLGSYSALQGLFAIPVMTSILYFNARGWFKISRFMVTYGLMLVALALALADRRTGTEFILIALGCCSVMFYEKVTHVATAFVFAFACYFFYTACDAWFPFRADPSIPYLLAQNFLMFLSGFAVLAQSLVFRFLVNDYAAKLMDYAQKLELAKEQIESVNQELKASNEELRAFSENLDQLVQTKSAQLQAYNAAINTSAVLLTIDRRGILLSVNEPLRNLSGYSDKELIGRHYQRFVTGQSTGAPFTTTPFTTAQLTGQQDEERNRWLWAAGSWTGEIEYQGKGGSMLWIDAVILPIRQAGQITEFLVMGIPITERKQLESKNLSAMQALEDVAFQTSHNLRAPLARMLGIAELLINDLLEKDEWVYLVKKLRESTIELDTATRDLTVFADENRKVMRDRR